jgi:hypothetical protein
MEVSARGLVSGRIMFHPGLWPQAKEADSRAKSKDSEIVPSLSSIMRACSDIAAVVTGPLSLVHVRSRVSWFYCSYQGGTAKKRDALTQAFYLRSQIARNRESAQSFQFKMFSKSTSLGSGTKKAWKPKTLNKYLPRRPDL